MLYFWKTGGSRISIMIIISSYQFDGAYRRPMNAIFNNRKSPSVCNWMTGSSTKATSTFKQPRVLCSLASEEGSLLRNHSLPEHFEQFRFSIVPWIWSHWRISDSTFCLLFKVENLSKKLSSMLVTLKRQLRSVSRQRWSRNTQPWAPDSNQSGRGKRLMPCFAPSALSSTFLSTHLQFWTKHLTMLTFCPQSQNLSTSLTLSVKLWLMRGPNDLLDVSNLDSRYITIKCNYCVKQMYQEISFNIWGMLEVLLRITRLYFLELNRSLPAYWEPG